VPATARRNSSDGEIVPKPSGDGASDPASEEQLDGMNVHWRDAQDDPLAEVRATCLEQLPVAEAGG
jgi:hypothetical protein